MEHTLIRKMRLQQLAATNLLTITLTMILFSLVHIFEYHFSQYFFGLGVFLFIQGIVGFVKKGSSKSIFPIFEKVAIYEKEKLGEEWYKEQKTQNIWMTVLSGLMFLQSYTYQGVTDQLFDIDLLFLFFILCILLALTNVSLLIRFKKIDRSTHEQELRGYTKESNMIGIALGLLTAVILFSIIFFFVIS